MAETKVWQIDNLTEVSEAAGLLKRGEVVAFPTETVYGLGADATSREAVAKIFEAKGRPADNPLIVHAAALEQIQLYVTAIPEVARQLLEAFSPGPLTIILNSNGTIAENVTAGLPTVAVRIPDHPVARALIEAAGLPLAAPSANLSGRPSPTSAAHVYQDLNGRIAGLIDGGNTGVGLESTVVDCTAEIPVILRPGGITKEELEKVVGEVMIDPALLEEGKREAPRAPGMKYAHYAPEAPLWLVEGSPAFLQEQMEACRDAGYRTGVIASRETAAELEFDQVKVCGSHANLKEVASQLYETLRYFKKADVDVILCETFADEGVGHAIMNRLHKAASRKLKQLKS